MTTLRVLTSVKKEIKRQELSIDELAKRMNMKPSSISGMLGRKTFQVQKLADLSDALNYNFFREFAEQFPYVNPHPSESVLEEKNNRIKELELEVRVLRQTFRDLLVK